MLQKQIDNKLLPSELRDRTRYGGNYLNIKDENCPPYSPFYVFISGHIESGQINDYDGICCKYDFMAGTDWSIVEVIYPFKGSFITIGQQKWRFSAQLQISID